MKTTKIKIKIGGNFNFRGRWGVGHRAVSEKSMGSSRVYSTTTLGSSRVCF